MSEFHDPEPDTRERLIQAGVDLVDEDGVDALALRSIARRAGVSHGAPRRYFPTHRALLAAVASTGLAELAALIDAALSDEVRSPHDRLVRASSAYVEFAAQRRGMFELMFRHDLLEGAGANLRATSLPLFAELTHAVAATGASHTPDAGRDRSLRLLAGVHGLAVLHANRSLEVLGAGAPAVGDLVADIVAGALS
ncbi:MAG: TetR/AcrR family transcriptional regulator [Gordonia sp. (in: high G+C Gram-positive bacteria)]|uniref:TetR/AcrR family transcriptional regulator n=1 Tax=Gordonia sp. (in: high G+C Gram-positive bacteria) TaxID=84139 RepID=UPI0039E56995